MSDAEDWEEHWRETQQSIWWNGWFETFDSGEEYVPDSIKPLWAQVQELFKQIQPLVDEFLEGSKPESDLP